MNPFTDAYNHAVMERMLQLTDLDVRESRIKELELALYNAYTALHNGANLLGKETAIRAYLETAARNALGALQSEEYMLRGAPIDPAVELVPEEG